MGEEKCCPCEAVKELQKKYEEVQERLYEGNRFKRDKRKAY